jgi:hypothetical protein
MSRLSLAHFLAEVAAKAGNAVRKEADPIGLILARLAVNPATYEAQALKRGCLAVITREGRMTEMELLSLDPDACALLRAFAEWRYMGRYPPAELFAFERKLRMVGEQCDRRLSSVVARCLFPIAS